LSKTWFSWILEWGGVESETIVPMIACLPAALLNTYNLIYSFIWSFLVTKYNIFEKTNHMNNKKYGVGVNDKKKVCSTFCTKAVNIYCI